MRDVIVVVLMWGVPIFSYLLPTFICWFRNKQHNVNAIVLINLLFGWTCIGWLVAFIWSVMDDPS